jgi:hypothetical protein
MKFTVKTSGYFYNNDDEMERLKKLGFTFKNTAIGIREHTNYVKEQYEVEIEVSSLEELVNMTKEYGRIIIDENTLEIYDDYRE